MLFKRISKSFAGATLDDSIAHHHAVPEHYINILGNSKSGSIEFGVFNAAMMASNLRNYYPWCFHLFLPIEKSQNPNEFPTDVELKRMHRFEKEQMCEVQLLVDSVHVGHLFSSHYFHIWWYLRSPDLIIDQYFRLLHGKEEAGGQGFQIKYDAGWREVDNYLRLPPVQY